MTLIPFFFNNWQSSNPVAPDAVETTTFSPDFGDRILYPE